METLLLLDDKLFLALNSLAGRFSVLDGVGIFFSTVLIFFLFAAALVYFLARRRMRFVPFVAALASSLSAWGLNQIIGEIYYRPRPFLSLAAHKLVNVPELSKSFPSDHAAIAFGLAFGVYLWNRRWGAALLIGACLVALGRVYVGVHYPSDVLAGAAIGAAAALIVHRLTHLLFKKQIKEIIKPL